jgi:acyl carrier protein
MSFTPMSDQRAGKVSHRRMREEQMVHDQIRAIVGEHARLSVDVKQLADDASLYQAGLTSHASVNLMLALEETFGIEFPERMLRRRTFESIASIAGAVGELTGPAGA